jgi:hypothetical protein
MLQDVGRFQRGDVVTTLLRERCWKYNVPSRLFAVSLLDCGMLN